MADYKFYYPDGKLIEGKNFEESRKKFIDFYSKCYYLFSSKSLEEEIEIILKSNGPFTDKQLAKILKWKTGGSIEYDNEDIKVKYAYGTLYIRNPSNNKVNTDIYTLMKNASKHICYKQKNLCKNKAIEFLEALIPGNNESKKSQTYKIESTNKENIKNVGIVYALTLLYFFTKGTYPIYDKFVHIALAKILSSKECNKYTSFNNKINYEKCLNISRSLPSGPYINFSLSSTKNYMLDIHRIFKNYKEKYIFSIEDLFGKDYQYNRNIDRALWIYGHLFNDTSDGKKPKSV